MAVTHVLPPSAFHHAWHAARKSTDGMRHRLHYPSMQNLDRWVNHDVLDIDDTDRHGIWHVKVAVQFVVAQTAGGPRQTTELWISLPAGQTRHAVANPTAGWSPSANPIRPVAVELARRPAIWNFINLDTRKVLADCSLWPRWPHLYLRNPGSYELGGEKCGQVSSGEKPRSGRYLVKHGMGKEVHPSLESVVERGWVIRRDFPANEPRIAGGADHPPSTYAVEFEGDPRLTWAPRAGRRCSLDDQRGTWRELVRR